MNKTLKIILAVLGGCSVVMEVVTPLVVALFLVYFSDLGSSTIDSIVLIVGGLASFFRGIKIGWLK
jgi:hypothetical protein